jgi:SAM-dependent methyltransferase
MSGFFRTENAIGAVLLRADVIRPNMRVLDAGCGFGLATFALLDALRKLHAPCKRINAFDLTPAMLARFRERLARRPDVPVEMREADVMDLGTLPPSWTGYDLVISTSMLEYLPRRDLPRALMAVRARMAARGTIVVMITRRSLESKVIVQKPWHAEPYSRSELVTLFADAGFESPRFIRFPLRYGWMNRANYVIAAKRP